MGSECTVEDESRVCDLPSKRFAGSRCFVVDTYRLCESPSEPLEDK